MNDDDDSLPNIKIMAVAEELKQAILKLNVGLMDNVAELGKYTKKTRMMTWGLAMSLILDVLLTMFITIGTIRLDELTSRLDASQTTERQKALCPLYRLFLDSKSDVARNRAPDPEKYDQAFIVIHDGYDALGCSAFIHKQP